MADTTFEAGVLECLRVERFGANKEAAVEAAHAELKARGVEPLPKPGSIRQAIYRAEKGSRPRAAWWGEYLDLIGVPSQGATLTMIDERLAAISERLDLIERLLGAVAATDDFEMAARQIRDVTRRARAAQEGQAKSVEERKREAQRGG